MHGRDKKVYEWSDIDVAVILPTVADDKWLETSVALGKDSDKVSLLIVRLSMKLPRQTPFQVAAMEVPGQKR